MAVGDTTPFRHTKLAKRVLSWHQKGMPTDHTQMNDAILSHATPINLSELASSSLKPIQWPLVEDLRVKDLGLCSIVCGEGQWEVVISGSGVAQLIFDVV